MQTKPHGVIYKITNLIDGKVYVGQTTQKPSKRWCKHKNPYKDNNVPIAKAIKEHGSENFKFEVIAECSSGEEMNELEEKYIIDLNSLVPNGYNVLKRDNTIYIWNRDRSYSFANKKKKGASSKYFGVSITKNGRWKSQIIFKGDKTELGIYETEIEAAQARDIEVLKNDYDNIFDLNFPELKENYLSGSIIIQSYNEKNNIQRKKRSNQPKEKKQPLVTYAKNKPMNGNIINVAPDIYYFPSNDSYSVIIGDGSGSILYIQNFKDKKEAFNIRERKLLELECKS
jgi:group I intron endonuclease